MRSAVISLHRAVRSLLVPQGARVETVHRRAVNLRLASGALVTLCAPELGNGPGALLVAADWPLPWRAGERLTVRGGEIHGPGSTVTLGGAAEWEPGPLPVLGALPLIRQGWRSAIGELSRAKGSHSPVQDGFAEFYGVHGESCGVHGEFCGVHGEFCGVHGEFDEFCRVSGNLGAFRRECRNERASASALASQFAISGLIALQSADWPEALSHLIGLGPGLTPSGDDLLAGFLLLAHRAGWAAAAPLREAILALPPGRTTPVSESLLHWAAQGVANERALHWLDALLQGAPQPIAPVLEIGATSGADFAAGVLLALDLFLKERAA